MKKSVFGLIISSLLLLMSSNLFAAQAETYVIQQNLHKIPLKPGVKPDDAIMALKSKAAELNMKLVSHQPLSLELKSRGIESLRTEIFQFCNPYDARVMINHNPIMAAYMPCRIALVEDENKQYWLLMLDLDVLINKEQLPLVVRKTAERVNETLKSILKAGATGNF